MSHVRPMLDVSDRAFLLEHPLSADGGPGARPHHPPAIHISTYRSVLYYYNFHLASQRTDPHTSFVWPTGFFFFLAWTLFTHHHIGEIRDDATRLGPSYWLGVVGWALLLAVLPVTFLVEKWTVPDVLPDLIKSADIWWRAPEVAFARSLSEGSHHLDHKSHGYRRYMSMP